MAVVLEPSVKIHFPLTVFFIWPLVEVFPPFSNFQTKLNFIFIETYIYIYINIDIDIESNIELNSIIHLYTSKSSVDNHICFTHSIHQKFSHML
jgi:hypothetical protein